MRADQPVEEEYGMPPTVAIFMDLELPSGLDVDGVSLCVSLHRSMDSAGFWPSDNPGSASASGPRPTPAIGQPIAEAGRVGRAVGGEVVPLAGVRREVVQLGPPVLIPLDQFEIALADGAARLAALVAVMRVVPEQGVASRATPFLFSSGTRLSPSIDLAGGRLDPGDLEDRRDRGPGR